MSGMTIALLPRPSARDLAILAGVHGRTRVVGDMEVRMALEREHGVDEPSRPSTATINSGHRQEATTRRAPGRPYAAKRTLRNPPTDATEVSRGSVVGHA